MMKQKRFVKDEIKSFVKATIRTTVFFIVIFVILFSCILLGQLETLQDSEYGTTATESSDASAQPVSDDSMTVELNELKLLEVKPLSPISSVEEVNGIQPR